MPLVGRAARSVVGRFRVHQRSGVGARPEVEIEQRKAEVHEAQRQAAILERGHIGGDNGWDTRVVQPELGIRPEVTVAKMLRAGGRAREPRAVLAELNDRGEPGHVCANERNGNPPPAGRTAPPSADLREHR